MQNIKPSNFKQVGNNYISGDASLGRPSSIIPPELVNNIVNEILTVIVENGIAPSSDTTQLYAAIIKSIQEHPQVKYLYNNYLDLIGYSGDTINLKDFTQFKKVLAKLLKMTSSLATDKQAGTVMIGDGLSINNGLLSIKNNYTELSTTTSTGTWNITRANINKHLYVRFIKDVETDNLVIKQLSGMRYPCKYNYTFVGDMMTLLPSDSKISMEVVNLTGGIVIAYQL